MPNLKYLDCANNPLPFFTLREWKQYWETLYSKWIKESINPPTDDVKKIADLIRENKAGAKFIQPYNPKWDNFEIVENLKEFDCRNNQLTSLPPMPNLERLYCQDNPLPFFTLREWKQYWNSTK